MYIGRKCTIYLQDDFNVKLVSLRSLIANEVGTIVKERSDDPRHSGVIFDHVVVS